MQYFWILILFPLIGALLNGIFGNRFSTKISAWLACSASGLSFLVALNTFWEFLHLPVNERIIKQHLFTWIQSGNFVAEFSFLLDPLSMVMILLVTGIGLLIHLYSVEYMTGDNGYYRYFAYLNLFIFMMSLLILADNYLLMFIGWEGVGLCSYLLIGHYLDKKSAGDAAKKAFVVNRIGDVSFILGIFLIFTAFGSVNYLKVFETVSHRFPQPIEGFGILGTITLLLFIGATGKSAQFPLYIWLPNAMEGPTPVSALIHAATMVTAGIYVIVRSVALYSRTPDTLAIIALIGTLTALLAAMMALVQQDIKKVLAYSTISQLGYMFLAIGVGAFSAGIFHLLTHAFFKALLFLGAGSVILALHHEQNLLKMGGLKKHLKITFYTMWIATLAISGVPFFSGFFSKDEILWKVFNSSLHGGTLLWSIGILVAGLTACYMFRLMFLTFHGQEKWDSHNTNPSHFKKPSGFIKLPLIVLAFFSVGAGYIGLPGYLGAHRLAEFLAPSLKYQYFPQITSAVRHDHLFQEFSLTIIAILGALIGIAIAYELYIKDTQIPHVLVGRFSSLYKLVHGKFFIDELYDLVLVQPIKKGTQIVLWQSVENKIIDGVVNGTASTVQAWSQKIKRIQSGYIRTYAAWILTGTILISLYYYWMSNS